MLHLLLTPPLNRAGEAPEGGPCVFPAAWTRQLTSCRFPLTSWRFPPAHSQQVVEALRAGRVSPDLPDDPLKDVRTEQVVSED